MSAQVSKCIAGEVLSDDAFRQFQRFALEHTGIKLGDNKKSMIVARFGRRLQALSLSTFEEYLEIISDPYHPETIDFIDTITTNLTYFFREPHHFKVLSERVLPELTANRPTDQAVRVWSAGCSSGQEPYSVAISVLECPDMASYKTRILCTDIHTKMVERTAAGVYRESELRGLSSAQKSQWFDEKNGGRWQAKQKLRKLLISRQLNLFSPWPIRSDVDVIVCRNVLIYFDESLQKKVLGGFAKLQKPGSYLFLGHSENLGDSTEYYRRVDNTVYRRL